MTEGTKSQWFNSFAKAQTWLKREEESRLEEGNISRPDTNFGFQRYMSIQISLFVTSIRAKEFRLEYPPTARSCSLHLE